ncbi:MAG: AraC family transcriptional regulator [Chitinophagaceae bacterium]
MKSNLILLNEKNWSQITSRLDHFPFRISSLQYIDKELYLKPISFKYNLFGKEKYISNQHEVEINTGEYLLATNIDACEVQINMNKGQDLGLCVDIESELLVEALSLFYNPQSLATSYLQIVFFTENSFFNKFKSNKYFDQYLHQLFLKIHNQELIHSDEVSFEFLKQFVFHHSMYLRYFQQVNVLKMSTRKDLYHRMMIAYNMIHDHLYSSVSMEALAQEVFLSKYRFYHLFKDTFGISPYQYVLKIKLLEAIKIFKKGYSWSEIASLLNFSDLAAFSKLFKKQFKLSPSEYALAHKRRKGHA